MTTRTVGATTQQERDELQTFAKFFTSIGDERLILLPSYQRAYSWEKEQITAFLRDLVDYSTKPQSYYFGHFIVEQSGSDSSAALQLVDGQQRMTTAILFIIVCERLVPESLPLEARSLLSRFKTVDYDRAAFKHFRKNLTEILEGLKLLDKRKVILAKHLRPELENPDDFTKSQQRIITALAQINDAFAEGMLQRGKISDYIQVILRSQCSLHLTYDKAVAVNIFEMHNTRGVPLTLLEVIKAKLMKFVFDNAGSVKEDKVATLQEEFGRIYALEERLASVSYRGDMTIDQLLRLHLRVIDDGKKKNRDELDQPRVNASPAQLIEYIDGKLKGDKEAKAGVDYAVSLASEIRRSVEILSIEILSIEIPAWDRSSSLVGDVIIQNRQLSCEFFFLIFRHCSSDAVKTDGRISSLDLARWDRLLFTQDFHGGYHGKMYRDDFPKLFESFIANPENISALLEEYLQKGFRGDIASQGLQKIAHDYLKSHQDQVMTNAFHFWKHKMEYALYKYEISLDSDIRRVMKGSISVEHILPQNWESGWLKIPQDVDKEEAIQAASKEIGSYINGIGNLLLLTPGENSSEGKKHPKHKTYKRFPAGSYEAHRVNLSRWEESENWKVLVADRGQVIFDFMLKNLVDHTEQDLHSLK